MIAVTNIPFPCPGSQQGRWKMQLMGSSMVKARRDPAVARGLAKAQSIAPVAAGTSSLSTVCNLHFMTSESERHRALCFQLHMLPMLKNCIGCLKWQIWNRNCKYKIKGKLSFPSDFSNILKLITLTLTFFSAVILRHFDILSTFPDLLDIYLFSGACARPIRTLEFHPGLPSGWWEPKHRQLWDCCFRSMCWELDQKQHSQDSSRCFHRMSLGHRQRGNLHTRLALSFSLENNMSMDIWIWNFNVRWISGI